MRSEVRQLILGAIESLIMDRTRDQFGRAWTQPAAFEIALSVTNEIDGDVSELVERNGTRDVEDQAINAKLQKAWWDSIKLAKKCADDFEGHRYFCRAMNRAFERKLF
jgi:hypothetical protein